MCCLLNRWLPTWNFVAQNDSTLYLNGQRREDPLTAGIFDRQVDPVLKIENCALIHSWTTKEVMEYIKIYNSGPTMYGEDEEEEE